MKELRNFLKSQPASFYNYPSLLAEIRNFYWNYQDEEITRINTNKNAKYSYCKIIYKMNQRKKNKFAEKEEGSPHTPHRPTKVRFLEEIRYIEDSTENRKERKETTSILKKGIEYEEEAVKTHNVYISYRPPHTSSSTFRYSEEIEEKNIPEKESS